MRDCCTVLARCCAVARLCVCAGDGQAVCRWCTLQYGAVMRCTAVPVHRVVRTRTAVRARTCVVVSLPRSRAVRVPPTLTFTRSRGTRMGQNKLEVAQLDRNQVQLDRDTIQTFYDITRKEVRDYDMAITAKDREMEIMEDNHRVEVRVYVQKVKHLEYEHKNALGRITSEVRAACVCAWMALPCQPGPSCVCGLCGT